METEVSMERTGIQTFPEPSVVAQVRRMSAEEIKAQLAAEPVDEPEVKEPVKEEKPVKEVEAKEPPVEKPAEPPKEEQKQETISREEFEALQRKIEEQNRTIEAKERFAQRQASELGMLRKQSPEEERKAIQEANERYEQIYAEQGKYAADEFMDAFKVERRNRAEALRIAEEQAMFDEKISRNKESVSAFIKDLDNRIPDLVALMQEDKADANVVETFRKNPYVADPPLLYNMAKRAELAKENISLKAQLAEKDARIAELEKSPQRLIENLTNATKSLNGKSSGTKTPETKIDYGAINPRRMSHEQIKQALRELD